jgi:hypothetical protein
MLVAQFFRLVLRIHDSIQLKVQGSSALASARLQLRLPHNFQTFILKSKKSFVNCTLKMVTNQEFHIDYFAATKKQHKTLFQDIFVDNTKALKHKLCHAHNKQKRKITRQLVIIFVYLIKQGADSNPSTRYEWI